uniref:GIY-YIG domain-containing protein n=1 Tax=Trichobilharzia regenti TaxID=157069 RepID=A0AA85KJT0_TRIRE|nr:unnamed protein product [Trichobilharzia regenti]
MSKKKKKKYQTLLKLSSNTATPRTLSTKSTLTLSMFTNVFRKHGLQQLSFHIDGSETSDDARRVLRKIDFGVFLKASNIMQSNLFYVKDHIEKDSLSNYVQKIKCLQCDAIYIGQISRKIKIRRSEHCSGSVRPRRNQVELKKLQKSSAICGILHATESGHKIDFDNIEITIHKKRFRNLEEGLISSKTFHIKFYSNCLVNRNDGLKQNATRL